VSAIPTVAVVDIGSNSIKVLVATRDTNGQVVSLRTKTLDVRISAGISRAEPRLSDDGMARGLAAIKDLLAEAALYSPRQVMLVATSAVRDAANGPAFRETVRRETGHEIQILTGDAEAAGIGRGLTCDPALAALQDFYVFDLGGGSLECIAFRQRQPAQALSLQLGCVRLTEKFVSDTTAPFSTESRAAIAAHTQTTLRTFNFSLGAAAAVGTGGTVSSVRALFGARVGQLMEATSPVVSVAQMRELLDLIAPMSLDQRRQIPGMPFARADVFPAALTTFIALAELGRFSEFRHSVYNLRYGLAAGLLDGEM
jgi:exopolyphosphatase/guanosine-5'-triphosphate,3'-diphosphate pyrophosphatase